MWLKLELKLRVIFGRATCVITPPLSRIHVKKKKNLFFTNIAVLSLVFLLATNTSHSPQTAIQLEPGSVFAKSIARF